MMSALQPAYRSPRQQLLDAITTAVRDEFSYDWSPSRTESMLGKRTYGTLKTIDYAVPLHTLALALAASPEHVAASIAEALRRNGELAEWHIESVGGYINVCVANSAVMESARAGTRAVSSMYNASLDGTDRRVVVWAPKDNTGPNDDSDTGLQTLAALLGNLGYLPHVIHSRTPDEAGEIRAFLNRDMQLNRDTTSWATYLAHGDTEIALRTARGYLTDQAADLYWLHCAVTTTVPGRVTLVGPIEHCDVHSIIAWLHSNSDTSSVAIDVLNHGVADIHPDGIAQLLNALQRCADGAFLDATSRFYSLRLLDQCEWVTGSVSSQSIWNQIQALEHCVAIGATNGSDGARSSGYHHAPVAHARWAPAAELRIAS